MAPKEVKVSTEGSRRSTRIKEQPPKSAPAPKPAPKKRAAEASGSGASKKTKAEKEAENEAEKEAEKEADDADELADDKEEGAEEKKAESKALQVGDAIPSITLKNENDEDFDVSTLKSAVVFLYPKANTPGCNKQACAFRDADVDFKALNYAIYGLSTDTPSAQLKWKTKNAFGYSFICDPKRTFISLLGAGVGGKTKRSHVVIGPDGKITHIALGVKPDESSKAALETIKTL